MHLGRRLFTASVVALLAVAPAMAAEPYFKSDALDLCQVLPPPPVAGSPADMADLRAVLAAQKAASAERKQQAVADQEESVFATFTPVLGARFNAEALPKTTALLTALALFCWASLDTTISPHA